MTINEDDPDMLILEDGPIVMYHNTIILDKDLKWFEENRYEVLDINASKWTAKNFHKKAKEAFSFPDYYGENLDAFNDCLGDMLNPKNRGLLIILRNFDDFAAHNASLTENLLDIISITSRRWLLSGSFLIGAIQSNDPDLDFNALGGIKPFWNANEWFDDERRRKIIRP